MNRVVLGALALLAGTAAATPTGFDAAYQAGEDHFHLGKYAEARADFARARDLAPRLPGPHRWLGRVERLLEHWDACVAESTEAVRLRPDSPLVPQVREDLDACRSALGRPPYRGPLAAGQGALAVEVKPDGTEVFVDGIGHGRTPVAPFPLNAGPHRLVVRGEGKRGERAVTLTVIPGITVDAEVE
jgi:hypothetical protein